jgi:hypothetical protein
MPNFDFIQPSVNPAVRGDRKPLTSTGSLTQTSEPFDQLMKRALSPSAGEPTQEMSPPAAKARSHGDGTSRSISDHSSRRRVCVAADANEPAASVSTRTGQLGLLPTDILAEGQISERDSADAVTAPAETPLVPGGSVDVLIPLIAALTNAAISSPPPAVLPTLTGGTEAPKEAGPNPTATEIVPSLITDELQKTASENQPVVLGTPKVDAAKPDQTPEMAGHPSLNQNRQNEAKSSPLTEFTQPSPAKPSHQDVARPSQLLVSELEASEISAASLTAPKAMAPPPASIPSDQVSAEPDVDLESVAAGQVENSGTPAAKQLLQMNNTDKMNKVAGSTEKELPGKADLVAQEKKLPMPSQRIGQDGVIVGPSANVPELMSVGTSVNGISAASAADMRVRALERTHDMIALQGVRLVDSKMDSLHVVIKPGAGMQLSLELRQRDGVIDAQVTLERGDFGPLNQHWSDLQQRLEQRGIRLAPLTGGDNFITDDGRNQFQQQQRQREFINPEPIAAGAFAEFALAQVNLQPLMPVPVLATAGRGWETWA